MASKTSTRAVATVEMMLWMVSIMMIYLSVGSCSCRNEGPGVAPCCSMVNIGAGSEVLHHAKKTSAVCADARSGRLET